MEYLNVWSFGKKLYDNQDAIKEQLGLAPRGRKLKSAGAVAGVVTIILVALLYIGFYVWSIVALMRYWRSMHIAAALVSLGLLIFLGPFFSLVVTYAAKA